jgi:hypothetical protein
VDLAGATARLGKNTPNQIFLANDSSVIDLSSL